MISTRKSIISSGICVLAALVLLSSSVAFARENGERSPRSSTVDASCMQTAVETRETALVGAWDDFNTSIKAALEARVTALKDAWGQSDTSAQKKANAAAWKTWKADSLKANKDLKTARKSAWDVFKKTAKDTCKVSVPKEESLGKDSSGSISL